MGNSPNKVTVAEGEGGEVKVAGAAVEHFQPFCRNPLGC